MGDQPAREVCEWYEANFKQASPRMAGIEDDGTYGDSYCVQIPDDQSDAKGFLFLRNEGTALVYIQWIGATPSGTGHGTRMLEALIQRADAADATLQALPRGREERLIAWYERHGFTGRGRNFMTRTPAPT